MGLRELQPAARVLLDRLAEEQTAKPHFIAVRRLDLALGDEAAYRDVRAPDGAYDATLAYLDVSSAVDGALAFAPTVDGVDVLDDAADVWAAASAPLYVAHNDGDPTNDVANSEYVAATYGGAGEVEILAGDAHAIADAPRCPIPEGIATLAALKADVASSGGAKSSLGGSSSTPSASGTLPWRSRCGKKLSGSLRHAQSK